MLNATIHGASLVIKHFTNLPDELKKQLEAEVSRQTQSVLKRAKQMVSGEVLNVRTGTLRRKINSRVECINSAIVGTVGIKLSYAAIHEFGFKGTIKVRAHNRRSLAQMKADAKRRFLPSGKSALRDAKKAKGSGVIQVRAHTREVDLPEKSYLRAALRELEPSIRAALERVVGITIK